MYRDFISYIQQNRVKVPNPENLEPDMAKLIHKWTKEHIELEYTMDAANKTEKIAAPMVNTTITVTVLLWEYMQL